MGKVLVSSIPVIIMMSPEIAMPESSIGLFPDVGASLFFGLPRANCALAGNDRSYYRWCSLHYTRPGNRDCVLPADGFGTDPAFSEIDKVIKSHQIDPGTPTLNQYMPSVNYIFGGDRTPEDMQEHARGLLLLRPSGPFVKQVVRAFADGCPLSIKVFWRLLQITQGFTSR